MAKITLNDFVSLTNQTSVVQKLNDNNDAIETAIENTLSRDGTSPNSMGAILDMNSNKIINLPVATTSTEPVRLAEFEEAIEDLVLGEVDVGTLAHQAGVFDTRTEVTTSDIFPTLDAIITQGYTTAGDNGGGIYLRVSSQPSHAGKIQSSDGAWWELSPYQWITPEQFGAIGDFVDGPNTGTENTIFCRNMTTFCNTKGAKNVQFKSGAKYHVLSDSTATNAGSVFAFTDLPGLVIKGNGAAFRTTFTGTFGVECIYLTRCPYHNITGILGKQTTGKSTVNRGIQWVAITDNSGYGYVQGAFDGGLKSYAIERGPGSGIPRSKGCRADIKSENIWYAVTLGTDGDNWKGTIYSNNSGRDLIAYNMRGIDATIDTADHTIDSLALSVAGSATEDNALSDVYVRFKDIRSTTIFSSAVDLYITQPTATSYACEMKNITIEVDIDTRNAASVAGVLLANTTYKPDTTVGDLSSGHRLENILIKGTVRGNTAAGSPAISFGEAAQGWNSNSTIDIKVDLWAPELTRAITFGPYVKGIRNPVRTASETSPYSRVTATGGIFFSDAGLISANGLKGYSANSLSLGDGGSTFQFTAVSGQAIAVTGGALQINTLQGFTSNGFTAGGGASTFAITMAGGQALGIVGGALQIDTLQGYTANGFTLGSGASTFAITMASAQILQLKNVLQLGTVSAGTGQLLLANTASAFLTTIQAGNAAAARTYTWPTNFGAANTVLQDAAGNGTLSWGAVGTVTSVGILITGGIMTVTSNSPVTTSGTIGITVAGTSGGIPYFNSATTWTSSGILAANALVIGGGAGTAPSTTTTGTGVLTALGINVGSAGAFTTFNGALGTPSSITLTNATDLPISTGISGLGSGVATFLATPSAANFVAMTTLTTLSSLVTVGTITSGVWNGGAVTSSGGIRSNDTTDGGGGGSGSLILLGGAYIAKSIYVAGTTAATGGGAGALIGLGGFYINKNLVIADVGADGSSIGGLLTLTGTTLRINQTPTAVAGAGPFLVGSASTLNTRISINMNGTTYWIPASTTAF